VNFSLPKHHLSPCTFKLTEVILLSSQNFFSVRKKITLLNLYQVSSRLVTRLKFSYTPLYRSLMFLFLLFYSSSLICLSSIPFSPF
jgi:hypothetical protein